jgi:hypothetical protein
MIERHRHFTPSAPMGGLRLTAVVVLGLMLAAWAIRGAIRVGSKRDVAFGVEQVKSATGAASMHELGRGLLAIVVVWLVWDQPGTLVPVVSVVGLLGSRLPLAIAGSLVDGLLRVVVVVLFALLLIVFAVFFRGLFAKLHARLPKKEKEETPLSLRSKTVAEKLEIEHFNNPGLAIRLAPLAGPLLHLAFAFGLVVIIAGAR